MAETITIGIAPPPASQLGTTDAYDLPGDPPAESFDTGAAPESPEVPEPVIRGILASMGMLLAAVPGVAHPDVPDHWQFTTAEMDALTPPVTRIVNARPVLRDAAANGDELTVAVQLAGFGIRNYMTGAKARADEIPDTFEEWTPDGNLDRQDPSSTTPHGGSAV